MADLGHEVLALDLDEGKISRAALGDAPFFEPGLQPLPRKNLEPGRRRPVIPGPGTAVMPRRAAVVGTACLIIGVLVGGCGGTPGSSGAAAAAPAVPGLDTSGPDLSGVNIPAIVVPNLGGPVSRPNRRLTPGAVATTNIRTVCQHLGGLQASVPNAVQPAVYNEYGYTTPALQHKYTLDYLVPLALGGSTSIANIWPTSMRGVGYFQKQQLNAVLFELVCHGAVPLVAAQRQIANDWYSAWLRYVVDTGRAGA
jgi:hypothetical protein